MAALPRVYAYRDHGTMGPTRWSPRKTICTSDANHAEQPGQVYVAKFCQGKNGAAAMISEIVCRRLFEVAGILVLDAVIVNASESFARSWNEMEMPYRIEPGEYFGTLYLEDVLAGPASEADSLDDLRDIVLIWVVDALRFRDRREVSGRFREVSGGFGTDEITPKLRTLLMMWGNFDCPESPVLNLQCSLFR